MKKLFLFCWAMFYCITFVNYAKAMTSNIKIGYYINKSSTSCEALSDDTWTGNPLYSSIWKGKCKTSSGNSSFIVEGVSVCSSTAGATAGQSTATSLSMEGDKQYCWCRMVSPAVSKYVFWGPGGTEEHCIEVCSNLCYMGLSGYSNILFQNLMYD